MRRFLKFVLAAALLLSSLYIVPVNATTNNRAVSVPLRIICESQGAALKCSKELVTIKKGRNTLVVNAKNNTAKINGKTVVPDSRIQIVNTRIKVPLSLINKAFGLNITRDEAEKIIAVKYMKLLVKGSVADCTMLYSNNLSQYVTADIVKSIGASFASYGELKLGETAINKNVLHDNVTLNYNSVLTGPFKYIIRFDSDMQIDDFKTDTFASMEYKAPQYDNKGYTEEEVIIGEGKWKLPGVLTVPKGKGPFPAVVLVHGSGPNDMDETLGPLKPFRDIAVGLASHNIAVLRYNKRSFEHNAKYALTKNPTVKEETVDDAISAVDFLSKLQEVDKTKIFVIGHSQGAMLMPKIVNSDKQGMIKGAIMMSGNSRQLQDVTIDQYQYFYKLGQLTKEQLDYYINQYSMINEPGFSADNPPKGFALGGAYWWADLKKYNQVEDAKGIKRPLFITQGARDYQVLAAKDYQGWKEALSDNSNVSFKLYPKLNHMYTEGEGEMSTNLEYFNQANVPGYVIDDISQWIDSVK